MPSPRELATAPRTAAAKAARDRDAVGAVNYLAPPRGAPRFVALAAKLVVLAPGDAARARGLSPWRRSSPPWIRR